MFSSRIVQITGTGLALMLLLWGCMESTPPPTSNRREKKPFDNIALLAALPKEVPVPADNPQTPEKIALGKLLFYDPILSGKKDVACATCHHPDFNFSDGQEISLGTNAKGLGTERKFNASNDIPFVKRNSQTVLNTAFNGITINQPADAKTAPMFWDLRVSSLEKQSLEPIKALEEMRGHVYPEDKALETVVERLKKIPAYQEQFKKAFQTADAITIENLGKAIASYERTLISNNSRFDQYMRGDKKAISGFELDGLKSFLKSGCAQCHNGPMFSDFKVHTLGVPDNEKLGFSDSGTNQHYAFRTATLRNLGYTYPYMHSGKFGTLERVLEFYEDLAGRKIGNKNVPDHYIDPLIKNLSVDFKDISLIVAFLNTLNDPQFDKVIPASVPSGLKVGGEIK